MLGMQKRRLDQAMALCTRKRSSPSYLPVHSEDISAGSVMLKTDKTDNRTWAAAPDICCVADMCLIWFVAQAVRFIAPSTGVHQRSTTLHTCCTLYAILLQAGASVIIYFFLVLWCGDAVMRHLNINASTHHPQMTCCQNVKNTSPRHHITASLVTWYNYINASPHHHITYVQHVHYCTAVHCRQFF